MKSRFFTSTASLISCLALFSCSTKSEEKPASETKEEIEVTADTKELVLGAGCFWCVEEIYEGQPGVLDVVSGYSGGSEPNPTYKQVGSGQTGHAEVVKITYDSTKIDLDRLLKIFWRSHDASDGRGVAPDFGPPYRSILFYQNEEEEELIRISKKAEAERLKKPVATEVTAFEKFWPAEDYHQDYVENNPWNGYVINVSKPRFKRTMKALKE